MNNIEKNNIHAFVISWDGMHDKAKFISEQIISHVKNLTVIYSNAENFDEVGVGDWVRVDNKLFFGHKFKKCLDIYQDGIFLLIHADADCSDWLCLINKCQMINKNSAVGVWAPNTYHTGWATEIVEIGRDENLNYSFVAQTDGIVFSMSKHVIERMRFLKYEKNNLGWGIDWAAICFSYCSNKLIIRDHSLFVAHPQGSGYRKEEAVYQMKEFMSQLTIQEKLMYKLLSLHVDVMKINKKG